MYRRVINRNNRLKRLIELGAPEIILRNEKRMLQEAVDALIDSAARVRGRANQNQSLRSLSDMLRGKQGRFRQNLLGKRVDYSGRSVIIVGPELRLNQIGLPKEMALELFKPFVLRDIISGGLAPNMKSAKHVLERRPPEVFDILENITRNHPVLANRAPTLHRLGIQAFFPVLIEGNAIKLHPCVCSGYNADFDGDQMAVHVPLSQIAQQEAVDLMMSTQNLLRPSDGSPITIPDKEMALGCYFMTTLIQVDNPVMFASSEEAVSAYQHGKINLKELIKVRLDNQIVETNVGRLLFNELLLPKLRFFNEPVIGSRIRSLITKGLNLYHNAEIALMIDRIKELGFWGATVSGLSMSVFDNKILPEKPDIIKEANRKVEGIDHDFRRGLITREERRQLSIDV
ncbi:MAG: DNA-directed RNA polymerase subunit beta', partial [Candidatus Levybacteria bacterium]|nr:DNA-directed RNA polymerase subunit beta' [Candidatus Levybacteria bacterium]